MVYEEDCWSLDYFHGGEFHRSIRRLVLSEPEFYGEYNGKNHFLIGLTVFELWRFVKRHAYFKTREPLKWLMRVKGLKYLSKWIKILLQTMTIQNKQPEDFIIQHI